MVLTDEQKIEQQITQLQIAAPIAVLGLIAGVIYASKKGKSKLGYGAAGYFGSAAIIALFLTITDYGNPTKK